MTPAREAFVLPVLFLTVVLAAAARPGATVTVVPPTPMALVAGTALFALLVRSGALAPERLINTHRAALANLNGGVVLATGFVASAQLFMALVPESGVPALIIWSVVIALVVQAFAIGPDRARLLRGLLVLFGAAFVLKFAVLAAISAPAATRMTRVLQVLFEGITLGTMTQRPPHVLEAYLAFAACAIYLIAVALLPRASWEMVRVPAATLMLDERGEADRITRGTDGR